MCPLKYVASGKQIRGLRINVVRVLNAMRLKTSAGLARRMHRFLHLLYPVRSIHNIVIFRGINHGEAGARVHNIFIIGGGKTVLYNGRN